jgi:predicted RNase H-like HicB family nuclease
MLYTVNIVIEKDEGGYYARCLDIDVGEARADSLEEVIKDIKEMIEIYLEDMSEEEIKEELKSREIVTTTLEIEVPKPKSDQTDSES